MLEKEFLTNEKVNGNQVYGKYVLIETIRIQQSYSLNVPNGFYWVDTGNSYFYSKSGNIKVYPCPYYNINSSTDSLWFVIDKTNKSLMFYGGGNNPSSSVWNNYSAYILVKYYKY